MNSYHVIVLDNPLQTVYGIKRTINITENEIQQLFVDLNQELQEKGIRRTGVAQLVYLDDEFSYENMYVEAQVQVADDTSGAHTMPACKSISVIHNGNHETLQEAYEAVYSYLAEHPEYHVAGPVIERFIQDDHTNENFQTAVLFPVVAIGAHQCFAKA